MVKIKFEDIMFWIFILLIIGTALWLLHGSPPDISAIITIAVGVTGSELLIWKKIFSIEKDFNCIVSKIDKNINISFMKMKNDFDKNNLMMSNKFDNFNMQINNKLDNLNNKITRRK